MIILHGENVPQSRQKLLEIIDHAKANQREVVRIEAIGLTVPKLEETLGTTDLFGQAKTIVVEGLHSLPKSKKKDELIALICNCIDQESKTLEIVVWESRSLTKTMLKPFGTAAVTEFKVSSSVFKWLDSLSPLPKTKATQLKLLHQATSSEDAFMCFAMLMRQIRLLIQVKDGGVVKGAPFMIAKLKKQASAFSLDQLLAAHQRLLEIDYRQKTSSGLLQISQELDLFLLQL